MTHTLPFALATYTPDRMAPSDRLLRLKQGLEAHLRGTEYLVRLAERPHHVTVDKIALDGYKLPAVEVHSAPVLEVYRLNYGLFAPLFNPDTVVATFLPMYEQDTETGVMRMEYPTAEGNLVVKTNALGREALVCGYLRLSYTSTITSSSSTLTG
ncbi:hypothetical protein HYV82_02520 [Candidatus Woesearchaeota archaeon]|nr:hypothetical protein [Candidatus Woesearchaeota archaeon]